jgi:hypothetical protein
MDTNLRSTGLTATYTFRNRLLYFMRRFPRAIFFIIKCQETISLYNNDVETGIDQLAMPKEPSPARSTVGRVIGRFVLHIGHLLIAIVSFGAYEHFKLHGQSTLSLVSLVAAAGFGFAPLRALVGELFAIKGRILHLVHWVGGLALGGLALSGAISGTTLLTHAALAPFAIMGAAQAVMHQDHPRNAEQAAAMRRFAMSLPQVEQFAKSGDLTSPTNIRRAVTVLSDVLSKAEVLGETELKSDPGAQSALRRVTMHAGLSLALDAVDHAITEVSNVPGTEHAVQRLRKQLTAVRKTIEKG